MRYSYALITGFALSLLPSISFAAPAPVASSATAEVRTTAGVRHAPSAVKPAQAQNTQAAQAQSAQTTKDDKSRYAKREAASPETQDYRGGDTVIIGSTAVVAILAVILILVLI